MQKHHVLYNKLKVQSYYM